MSLILRCQNCRSADLQIGEGVGPHFASLVCGHCGRRLRWLSKYQAKSFGAHLPTVESRVSSRSQQLDLFASGNGEG